MPTKERKKRAAELETERRRLDQVFASIPEYIANSSSNDSNAPTDLVDNLPSECRLRGGLVKGDDDGGLIAQIDRMNAGTQRVNSYRIKDRQEAIEQLQKNHPTHWGKRGHAKIIAAAEGLSVRTIQQYFRDSKQKTQGGKEPQ